MQLNPRAAAVCRDMITRAGELRIAAQVAECGATIIDLGIEVAGGLEAGRMLARVCLSDLGQVEFQSDSFAEGTGLGVAVRTDYPLAACMASQYAGWQLSAEKFFAMGSGPMRALAGKEKLFHAIGLRETADCAVGVLETRQLPPDGLCRSIASDCNVSPKSLILLTAPTASQAGTVQVVARTVETCMHKLHELGFDIAAVESGVGFAPLPPVARDDLTGIGWTNDAVLYGGRVTLWLRGDDQELAELVRRVPSCASSDFGEPFLTTFERYERDFYKIDPLLFSPAQVAFVNLGTGRVHRFGELRPDVLRQSFAM